MNTTPRNQESSQETCETDSSTLEIPFEGDNGDLRSVIGRIPGCYPGAPLNSFWGPMPPMPGKPQKFTIHDASFVSEAGESCNGFYDFHREQQEIEASHMDQWAAYTDWISGQEYASSGRLDLAKKLASEHLTQLKQREASLEKAAREFLWGFAISQVDALEFLNFFSFQQALSSSDGEIWEAMKTQKDEPDVPGLPRGWRLLKDGKRSSQRAIDESDSRPKITIETRRDLVVNKSLAALIGDAELFSRGGKLVIVVDETEAKISLTPKTILKGTAGTPKIITLSDSNVGIHLTANVDFLVSKYTKKLGASLVKAHPPNWLIASVASHKYYPGLRILEAVVGCPYPRTDGTIVESPGYERETKTLYRPTIEFPAVPVRPTQDDARTAWRKIREFFREFPFATEDDSVVVLAGMLTIIARPAIEGPVPGIAVIGNKAGTGKGLLIDCMAIPGTGFPAPTSNYPSEDAEAVKVKVSIALAGKRVIHFDNLEEGTAYGSGPLDSALTTTTIEDRLLGSNEMPELPLRPAWFLSGNNIAPSKDAYRRWIVCNLKTDLEHPEERTDIEQKNLRKIVQEHRAEIVVDALTILRAHALENWPRGDGWGLFGSFEAWDHVVRGAVWYATGRDCLTTQRQTARTSPDRQKKIGSADRLE